MIQRRQKWLGEGGRPDGGAPSGPGMKFNAKFKVRMPTFKINSILCGRITHLSLLINHL